jgi:hypothetical protein
LPSPFAAVSHVQVVVIAPTPLCVSMPCFRAPERVVLKRDRPAQRVAGRHELARSVPDLDRRAPIGILELPHSAERVALRDRDRPARIGERARIGDKSANVSLCLCVTLVN